MYRCPHCDQAGVRLFAKICSGSASPTACQRCGRLSYVRTFWHVKPGLFASVALVILAVLGVKWDSFVLLGIGIASYLFIYGIAFHREPMRPTSSGQVLAAQPYSWAVFLAGFVLIGAAYLLSQHW